MSVSRRVRDRVWQTRLKNENEKGNKEEIVYLSQDVLGLKRVHNGICYSTFLPFFSGGLTCCKCRV